MDYGQMDLIFKKNPILFYKDNLIDVNFSLFVKGSIVSLSSSQLLKAPLGQVYVRL